MNFLSFFSKKEKNKTPAIKWVSLSWIWGRINLKYNFSSQVFFDFYQKNPYIQASINRIKKDVASNWFWILINENEIEKDIFEKILMGKTSKSFFERIVRDLEVSWNTYVYIARDEWDNTIWLQVLDPRYITPIVDNKWSILWYLQNLYWVRAFTTDEVFHLFDDSDLENETLWRSKMTSLFLDLMSDKEAGESNYSFFKNNQVPSTIVVTADSMWTDQESVSKLKNVKELFTAENYWGWENANRVAFVKWIDKIIQVQQKMDDMQFMNMRKFTLDMVCAVYEVPKDILWFTDSSNRAVSQVQADNYFNNINAKETLLEQFLNKIIKVALWEEYSFVIYRDNLRILERKTRIAKELYKDWELITLNEAREIIQYGEIEEWKKVYQKSLQKAQEEII